MTGEMKQHWEDFFQHKAEDKKSWFQSYPSASIAFIEALHLPKDAEIIDVGGGDSRLVDALLKQEYTNITVLDISSTAIENVKRRLGKSGDKIKWVVSDILDYRSGLQFDLWHDRAAFHFLTVEEEIKKYIRVSENSIASGGFLILGTFSEKGPQKCSGLEIKQYSQASMALRFENKFERIKCIEEPHVTPTKNIQNFIFCSFKKRVKDKIESEAS